MEAEQRLRIAAGGQTSTPAAGYPVQMKRTRKPIEDTGAPGQEAPIVITPRMVIRLIRQTVEEVRRRRRRKPGS